VLTLFNNAPILRLRAKLLYSFEGFRTILVLVRRSAEALETQGRWQEAAAEYRNVLAQNPRLPGIHYRLGQLILSQPKTPTTAEDAHREFEEELKINPSNAGAEYVLGELARQADQWPQAIEHFSRASKLDSGFGDAFIGLGRSLIAGGRAPEAIPPLETAAKLQPDNPVCHYYPAMAYRRTGRKADADREVAVHKQMSEKSPPDCPGSSTWRARTAARGSARTRPTGRRSALAP
jgi:tetratricopeptide (TPR) repeat protein